MNNRRKFSANLYNSKMNNRRKFSPNLNQNKDNSKRNNKRYSINLNNNKDNLNLENYNNNILIKKDSNVEEINNTIHLNNKEMEKEKDKDKNEPIIISTTLNNVKPEITNLKFTKSNLKDSADLQGSNIKSSIISTQRIDSGENNEKPETILNLPKPLIKKIKKKIKERRKKKKKKLYKMLISKISESLGNINPSTLNSSINNSYNINSNIINNNIHLQSEGQKSYILQNDNSNSKMTEKNEIERIPQLNGQNLLIIPEYPELDSGSSSENSKSSNESDSNSISVEKKKLNFQ